MCKIFPNLFKDKPSESLNVTEIKGRKLPSQSNVNGTVILVITWKHCFEFSWQGQCCCIWIAESQMITI